MYFGVIPFVFRSASVLRQQVHPHSVPVERNPDHLDAEPRQPVQRALIGVLLDDDGIAARQQRGVDEVERLQRAGHDQDVVGDTIDAGVALQFPGQEFAQGAITLRTAGKPVGGERPALALEHGIDRLGQPLDRDRVGIVVAADKAVLCQAGPLRGRSGQSRWQQRCEVEWCRGHGRHPRLIFLFAGPAAPVSREKSNSCRPPSQAGLAS